MRLPMQDSSPAAEEAPSLWPSWLPLEFERGSQPGIPYVAATLMI
jgi:hypothetical protein